MENENMKSKNYYKNMLKFIICSALGIIAFFVPIAGELPFARLYKIPANLLGGKMIYVILLVCGFRFFGFFYGKYIAKKDSFMYKFFEESGWLELVLYFLAFSFTIMVILQKGIAVFYSDKTAGMMIKEVLPHTMGILPVGGLLLPLLASFGLLEFIGTLLEPIMRPVLKLPGKSALDAITSIVGAAVMGIYFTSSLYKSKVYTNKEATCISTSFSLNSVGFCAFLIGYVGLIAQFGKLFLLYTVISFILAAVMIRIPPISKHPDVYVDGSLQTDEMRKENIKFNKDQFSKAVNAAVSKADNADSIFVELGKGLLNGFGILFTIVPMMVAIAGIGLAVYEFTPVVDYVSIPFVWLAKLLAVPEAALAGKAVFTGGIDLFLPSAIIGPAAVPVATKFFVVIVSLLEVLYITETMIPIISFGLPVKFSELIIIWIERTVISMIVVAAFMHILF